MKLNKYLLFSLILLRLSCFADIIPENSHTVNRRTYISNIEEFPEFVFIGIVEGPMVGDKKKYIVKNDVKLDKGYKFNRVDIYAVKKDYYDQKGGLNYIDFKSDKNSVKINDEVLIVGSGYISNDKPISDEFYYYSVEKLENEYLNIYLSKKITVYTDGKEDLVQNFESDFKIVKPSNENTFIKKNENELPSVYSFDPNVLNNIFSSSIKNERRVFFDADNKFFDYNIWKIRLMVDNDVKLSKKVLLKWAVEKHKDKIIYDLVNKDTITTYPLTFNEGQPGFEETLKLKLSDKVDQEEISHALSYAINTSNIDLIKNLIGHAEFTLDNHLLNAFKIQNKTGENREEAIKKEFERILPFLEAGADLKYVDEDKNNILDYCIHEYPGNFDIVLEKLKFLKERNFLFDPDKEIIDKLFTAVISSPSSEGVILNNSVKLLDFLFANIFTFEHVRCRDAIFTAISKAGGNTEIIEALIRHGADINVQLKESNITPLIYSINLLEKYKDSIRVNNVLTITSFLLRSGSNVNLRTQNGSTALHYAVKNGVNDIVKLLLENGAEINVVNESGNTPLHYAVKNADNQIVKLLLENGADVNLQPLNCDTALHYAAQIGDIDLVKLLLEKGAKKDQINGFNAPPMYYSKNIQTFELLKLDIFDLYQKINTSDTFFLKASQEKIINFIGIMMNSDSPVDIKINPLFDVSNINRINKFIMYINKLNYPEINEKDTKGWTALHFSVSNDDINLIIKIFLIAGAEINLKYENNLTGLVIRLNSIKFSTNLREPNLKTEEEIKHLLEEWEKNPDKTRKRLFEEHPELKGLVTR
jgi:ankyrin repeat protein